MATIIDGELIRLLREQRGWSQRELSVAAKIDPSVVSRLERGLQSDVKLSVVVPLASVLNVSIDLLVGKSKSSPHTIIPELELVVQQISEQPTQMQRFAAGILRGLLSAIDTK